MSESIERTGLVKYDAMQRAIIAAHAVDEVKQLRDQAQALQRYAQQARNIDAERRAADIRIRAELKTGELLKASEKAKGGGDGRKPKGHRSQRDRGAKTLTQLGLSETQSSRWQKLAEAPKAVERYLRETAAEGSIPTTSGALEAAIPLPKLVPYAQLPFSKKALWFASRLTELSEEKLDPERLARECDDMLQADLRKSIDTLLPFLKRVRGLL